MSIEFKLPELGENITGGDVVNVLVREGQTIDRNQGIMELETDKAVIEVPCSQQGLITKLLVKKGDRVKVGQTILTLEAAGEPESPSQPPASAEGTAAVKPAKQDGRTATGLPAARSETPAAPVLSPSRTSPPPLAEATTTAAASRTGPIPAGPAVRRLARELGVDLALLEGSGEHGRITVEDVKAALAAPVRSAQPTPASPPAASPATVSNEPVVPPGEASQDAWGPVRRERMSQIRRTIAIHMTKSAATIPHVTNFDDADVTDLERLRKTVPQGFVGANLKLTTMPFVMKAVAIALRRHPLLNATFDEPNEQVVYKQYVHLGVAVDTPRGLVVPVVRNVDRMTIPEIARAIASVAERARQVQFAIEDLRGGTFTISNLGAVGGTYSTPIINFPEVAILLLGRSRWMPMVKEQKIEPRLMMPLSLSYDHRLVDGAAASRFLNEVIDYLQAPGKLLLAER
jgi:pyruvate dehydrogenase E2 component (dihydrolipoamide acetyltransferase)